MVHKKIALIHPQFKEGGGAEAPALWMVEALKKDHDVTLISMGHINLDRLNECYGTHLNRAELRTVEIPIPKLLKNRFDALRSFRLARISKQRASEFDLMISSYNVMDFGRKGIQYISDFSFDDRLRRALDTKPRGFQAVLYRKSPFRWLYLKLGKILAGASKNGWKHNLTIANSDWSGKVLREVYGIEARTIYPPVVGKFPRIPWENKECGFVCIGRLVPEKGIDRIIDILKKVRERGRDIHLHFLGRSDDSDYAKKIRRLCEENSDWAFMEGTLFSEKKTEFIAQHKYGISGRENEPFGIAVAELVKGGSLVWVPASGGQTEIVDHPALIYKNTEDAANKIEKVLGSETLQNELQIHMAKQSEIFSEQTFMKEISHIVYQFWKENASVQE